MIRARWTKVGVGPKPPWGVEVLGPKPEVGDTVTVTNREGASRDVVLRSVSDKAALVFDAHGFSWFSWLCEIEGAPEAQLEPARPEHPSDCWRYHPECRAKRDAERAARRAEFEAHHGRRS